MIAGAIGLVLVIAVGGWFALSGSTEPVIPVAPSPVVHVEQPAQPETSPTEEVITSTQPQPETTAVTEADLTQQAAAPKAAPAAKPKKTEVKPGAEKKKAVTVDDLINDN
jgi:hypothetical protein